MFSLLGLSVKRVDQLVEIARVVAGASGVYLLILSVEIRQSRIVLDELSARTVIGDAARYHRMAHAVPGEGVIEFAPQPKDHVFPERVFVFLVRLWVALTIFGAVLFAVGGWAVNIAVLWSMFTEPAIGPFVSRALAAVTLILDAVILGLLMFAFLPLPFRNYTDVNETQPILEREGRDVWWAEIQRRLAAREAAKQNAKGKNKTPG